ncbi:MAG: asparaginase [Candidatus Dormibacteraeota bacterium]|nr:asparaginase [Candidatus Dormibacteraeota bacterium]
MPNPPAPLVAVERGGIREATHAGHLAAVDASGRVRHQLGEPQTLTYFRSCAKPFQTIAGLRSEIVPRYGLTPEHIGLMSASHNGEPRHLAIVRDLLGHAGLEESALRCGAHWPYYEPAATEARRQMAEPLAVFNNCSGKHAGMLAAAHSVSASLDTYLELDHPVQRQVRATLAEFTGVSPDEIRFGIDGCSAPNAAVPLAAMARAFATLVTSRDDYARAVVDAMTGDPYLIGGTDRFDTALMEATGGRLLAKGGAAGAHCTADRRSGQGLALKFESGDGTWTAVAVVAVLQQLGWLEPGEADSLRRYGHPVLRNVRQLEVGIVRPLLADLVTAV